MDTEGIDRREIKVESRNNRLGKLLKVLGKLGKREIE